MGGLTKSIVKNLIKNAANNAPGEVSGSSSYNLLDNHKFETGDFTNWNVVYPSGSITVQDGSTTWNLGAGAYLAYFENGSNSSANMYIEQTISAAKILSLYGDTLPNLVASGVFTQIALFSLLADTSTNSARGYGIYYDIYQYDASDTLLSSKNLLQTAGLYTNSYTWTVGGAWVDIDPSTSYFVIRFRGRPDSIYTYSAVSECKALLIP